MGAVHSRYWSNIVTATQIFLVVDIWRQGVLEEGENPATKDIRVVRVRFDWIMDWVDGAAGRDHLWGIVEKAVETRRKRNRCLFVKP